ncbi:thioredoxin domain-containing protein, partial [Sinorhizobium meliloti]
MVEIYAEKKAAKESRSIHQVREALFEIEPVNEDEVKALYEQFKDRIGMPYEQVKGKIQQELESRNRRAAVQKLVAKIKQDTGFESKLSEPEAPVLSMDLSDFPWKGNKNAEITVVEFADYNCGYCQRAKPEVDKFMKQYGDYVRMYYVDFPVTERGVPGSSTQTARGAYCAGKQN